MGSSPLPLVFPCASRAGRAGCSHLQRHEAEGAPHYALEVTLGTQQGCHGLSSTVTPRASRPPLEDPRQP